MIFNKVDVIVNKRKRDFLIQIFQNIREINMHLNQIKQKIETRFKEKYC